MRLSDTSWIGRWPRRFAALSCLALAALAAIQHSGAEQPTHPGPTVTADQRVVPVTVAGDPHTYLAAGDLVELLTTPGPADPRPAGWAPGAVVAARALIVSIPSSGTQLGESGWQLVVAVDEATARRLAALGSQPLLAATGNGP